MCAEESKQRITVWFHRFYVDKIADLVEKGEYNNPSELIREAVRQWFMQRERRVVEYRAKFPTGESERESDS